MAALPDSKDLRTTQDQIEDPMIDLRDLKFSWFSSNSAPCTETESFLDLRTTRIREYGWRDIPTGESDHDSYDDLGDRNVSLVLSTESGVLLAGTRITQPKVSFLRSTSVAMWEPTPFAIEEHELLHELYASGKAADNTRLLLSNEGRPEHILILLGAGFEATELRVSPFFTITNSLHRFIRSIDLHMTVVHTGSIGGEDCVFGFFTPERIFDESGQEAVQLLKLGQRLALRSQRIFTTESDPTLTNLPI